MAVAVFTTASPTSAQLEAEWRANWRGNVALRFGHAWLHVGVALSSYVGPPSVSVYLRDTSGRWGLAPDGAVLVSTPSPADGVARLRYLVGEDTCGVVVQCATSGTATVTSGEG